MAMQLGADQKPVYDPKNGARRAGKPAHLIGAIQVAKVPKYALDARCKSTAAGVCIATSQPVNATFL